jgi:hypothetical protein
MFCNYYINLNITAFRKLAVTGQNQNNYIPSSGANLRPIVAPIYKTIIVYCLALVYLQSHHI